jgi:hypothetical protein
MGPMASAYQVQPTRAEGDKISATAEFTNAGKARRAYQQRQDQLQFFRQQIELNL